jgi:hypothetical protein
VNEHKSRHCIVPASGQVTLMLMVRYPRHCRPMRGAGGAGMAETLAAQSSGRCSSRCTGVSYFTPEARTAFEEIGLGGF